MHFPKRLSALRKEHGLTQLQMAERVGIHVSQYKRYEAGTSQPTIEVFQRIVVAMNVSADALLFDDDERGPDDTLRLHFEAVSKLSPEEQDTIISVIDGLLLKHDAQRWSQPRKRAADKSSG
jgi:transcriptional regulator with XRE-family HTH domain